MPDSPEQEPPEPESPGQPSMGRRLAWLFAIAAVMGLAFAAAAGLLRRLLLH